MSQGIDVTGAIETDEKISLGGVLFEMVLYPGFGLWVLPAAFGLSIVATVVASLYPAWFVTRTDPANALRVDR